MEEQLLVEEILCKYGFNEVIEDTIKSKLIYKLYLNKTPDDTHFEITFSSYIDGKVCSHDIVAMIFDTLVKYL